MNKFNLRQTAGRSLMTVAVSFFLTMTAGIGGIYSSQAQARPQTAEDLFVVDCLLPGQVRKLGRRATYVTPRRPIRTTQSECEIRGGEYVSFDRANLQTALSVWMGQAEEGDAKAQNYVGEIYEKGLGTDPNFMQAAHWYQMAADQGYTQAMLNLGYLYEQGLGVQRDITVALNWYRQASGLTDDDLTFASTVTVSAEAQAEIESLRTQVAAQAEEVEQLREQLNRTESELNSRRRSADEAAQEIERLRQEMESKKQSGGGEESAEIKQLREALEARESELAQQRARIEWLEEETDQQTSQTQDQLSETQAREKELEAALAERTAEVQQYAQRLKSAESELDQKRQALETASSEVDQLRQSLNSDDASDADRARLEAELEAREASLARITEEMTELEVTTLSRRTELEIALKDAEREEQSLREELARVNGETEALRAELARTQKRLEDALSTLESERNALEEKRQEFQGEQQAVGSVLSDADVASLAVLEEQLARRQHEYQEAQKEISRLEREAEERQAQLNDVMRAQTSSVAAVGPSIEIIDPPLTVTRGAPAARLRSASAQREIVGKVEAPAGLMSFVVNDKPQDLSESGLFRVAVPLSATETEVSVSAVDTQGRRAALDFKLLNSAPAQGGGIATASTMGTMPDNFSVPRGVRFGDYHALIIGNNNYPNMPNLNTAVSDARQADKLLRQKYGFKTTVLIDATRYEILSALNDYRESLGEQDNFLVYYAGHGELDRKNMRGHWLPVDASAENPANWISNVAITDVLNTMAAKHVLVVADSCYSGAMTRSSLASLEADMSENARRNWVKLMANGRSRTALTSGGLSPVLDSGGGDHSVFAKVFFTILEDNNGLLAGQRLYREVSANVALMAAQFQIDQVPEYAPIKFAGHEAGDFFFVPVDRVAQAPATATIH